MHCVAAVINVHIHLFADESIYILLYGCVWQLRLQLQVNGSWYAFRQLSKPNGANEQVNKHAIKSGGQANRQNGRKTNCLRCFQFQWTLDALATVSFGYCCCCGFCWSCTEIMYRIEAKIVWCIQIATILYLQTKRTIENRWCMESILIGNCLCVCVWGRSINHNLRNCLVGHKYTVRSASNLMTTLALSSLHQFIRRDTSHTREDALTATCRSSWLVVEMKSNHAHVVAQRKNTHCALHLLQVYVWTDCAVKI